MLRISSKTTCDCKSLSLSAVASTRKTPERKTCSVSQINIITVGEGFVECKNSLGLSMFESENVAQKCAWLLFCTKQHCNPNMELVLPLVVHMVSIVSSIGLGLCMVLVRCFPK